MSVVSLISAKNNHNNLQFLHDTFLLPCFFIRGVFFSFIYSVHDTFPWHMFRRKYQWRFFAQERKKMFMLNEKLREYTLPIIFHFLYIWSFFLFCFFSVSKQRHTMNTLLQKKLNTHFNIFHNQKKFFDVFSSYSNNSHPHYFILI